MRGSMDDWPEKRAQNWDTIQLAIEGGNIQRFCTYASPNRSLDKFCQFASIYCCLWRGHPCFFLCLRLRLRL